MQKYIVYKLMQNLTKLRRLHGYGSKYFGGTSYNSCISNNP